MDTQLLEAFIAVAECGSFSLAAERVHITQPAISKRIAQLEDQLGSRLFDRISRTIYLTEAGEALLPRAEKILLDFQETRQAIRDLSGHISGSLRLAISHHIGLHRLPPILKQFVSTNPGVNLNIEFMDSEIAYDGVLHGKFEVGVITLAPEEHPRILANAIWPDPLVLMVANEHPLADQMDVDIFTLQQYPAILPGLETYTGRMIKQLFADNGLTLNATMATNYLETIKMLMTVGLGWTILPKSMEDDGVSTLHCKQLHLTRTLGFIQHREKTLSNAGQAFINLLLESREMPPLQ